MIKTAERSKDQIYFQDSLRILQVGWILPVMPLELSRQLSRPSFISYYLPSIFFLKTPGSQISAGSLQDCRGKLDGTFQNSNPATSGSRFLKRFSRLASKKKRDGQVEEIERKQRTRKRNNKNDNDNQRRVKPLKRLKSSVINNLPRGEGDEKNTHTLTHWE